MTIGIRKFPRPSTYIKIRNSLGSTLNLNSQKRNKSLLPASHSYLILANEYFEILSAMASTIVKGKRQSQYLISHSKSRTWEWSTAGFCHHHSKQECCSSSWLAPINQYYPLIAWWRSLYYPTSEGSTCSSRPFSRRNILSYLTIRYF